MCVCAYVRAQCACWKGGGCTRRCVCGGGGEIRVPVCAYIRMLVLSALSPSVAGTGTNLQQPTLTALPLDLSLAERCVETGGTADEEVKVPFYT